MVTGLGKSITNEIDPYLVHHTSVFAPVLSQKYRG